MGNIFLVTFATGITWFWLLGSLINERDVRDLVKGKGHPYKGSCTPCLTEDVADLQTILSIPHFKSDLLYLKFKEVLSLILKLIPGTYCHSLLTLFFSLLSFPLQLKVVMFDLLTLKKIIIEHDFRVFIKLYLPYTLE